jgi:signal transduction histidine kinase
LRSPLTAVKGYLDLLKGKKDLRLDSESSRYLDNIGSSIQRLDDLVEDVLDVSRIEGNRLPMEITSFDPAPAILQCVEEMRSQAIQKGLALNYKPAPDAVLIRADVNRLKQIIVNLIGNAIKYTPKGSIDVSTAQKNGKFTITVADTGIGMSSEDQANLFQKFYRIKNDQTRNIIGTGLGLWITLETAKKMDGKITVESIEDVGSHFTLHLPLAKK